MIATLDLCDVVLPRPVQVRLLIRFDESTSPRARLALVDQSIKSRSVSEVPLVPGLCIIPVPGDRAHDIARDLRASRDVRYVEMDHRTRTCAQEIPYGILMISADTVWPRWGSGAGTRVATLDTGVDRAHPDLAGPILSVSYIPSESVDDFANHGSHVAGIILALNNSIGVVGTAPAALLMPAKILDNNGEGLISDAISAIGWAVANNARVINLSFGDAEYSQAFADACLNASNAGVLLVAGAGNTGDSEPFYPAQYPGVLAVSAVDATGSFASFSSFGQSISVAAPGVEVESTVPIVGWHAIWSGVTHDAAQLRGGTVAAVTAGAFFCGAGSSPADFPPAVAGNIAHIRRSAVIPLADQVANAVEAGAIGVVVSNNVPGGFAEPFSPHVDVPVASISQADGDNLISHDGTTLTLNQFYAGHDFATLSGTSMACAHVAGVAALLIGNFPPPAGLPPIPPASTRWILEQTAERAGVVRDDRYGWGIVNAERASAYLQGRIRCPGDFDGNGIVDDGDFVAFAAWYDALLTPGGAYTAADLNGDALVDDSDFGMFVTGYDRLMCP